MKILFIQTGGTIDKDYPKSSGGYAFEFGEPATKRILERLNPSFEYEILTAFQKDSLEITAEDREALKNLIRERPETRMIITHGTDTLIQTARFLSPHFPDICIALTGAMRPERFSNSDAPINLGMAIACVQQHEKGTFVCMHGKIKPASEIQRNTQTGRFY